MFDFTDGDGNIGFKPLLDTLGIGLPDTLLYNLFLQLYDYQEGVFVEVPEDKAIEFKIVEDDEKWGLSVTDQSGSLTLNRVLEKIERHTAFDDKPVPEGIEDLSGRGLFILSRQNRLIINILNTVKTEIIVMRFKDSSLNRYQSFIINEKNPGNR